MFNDYSIRAGVRHRPTTHRRVDLLVVVVAYRLLQGSRTLRQGSASYTSYPGSSGYHLHVARIDRTPGNRNAVECSRR